MKSIIKTSLFASIALVAAINYGTISELCLKEYNERLNYMATNLQSPYGFFN
ncbi:MAG: hypothetical protein R2783_06520 [Gelidibacter sp.]